MNINQLKYVLEVAASSSMREAATNLFITQPALSASIRELEEELGILIFNRTNKGISLTPEGREFLVYAKQSVGQYAILEDRYLSANRDRERFQASRLEPGENGRDVLSRGPGFDRGNHDSDRRPRAGFEHPFRT